MSKRKKLPDKELDHFIASPILSCEQFDDLEQIIGSRLSEDARQRLDIEAFLYLDNRYRKALGHTLDEQRRLLNELTRASNQLLDSLTRVTDVLQRLGKRELRTLRVILKSDLKTHPLETFRKIETFEEDIRNLSNAAQRADASIRPHSLLGLTEQRRQKVATDLAICGLVSIYEDATGRPPKAYQRISTGKYDTPFVHFVSTFLLAVDHTNQKWFTRSPNALGKRVQEQLSKRRKQS